MSALFEKVASTPLIKKAARFLVPHQANNHHAYLIRHEGLFVITFLLLAIQFFSFGGVAGARVLGYATNITQAAVINLTNQERVKAGMQPLAESSKLDSAATMKAGDMFAKDYWAHYAPDGTSPWYFFKLVGYNYSWAGENLARDFSTSEGVVAGWMGSTSHKDNLMNPNFTEIGIGVKDGILQGEETTLVVQHLGKVLGSATSAGSSSAGGASGGSQPAKVEDSLATTETKPSVASASANVEEVHEKISGTAIPAFNLGAFWKGLGFGQKSTLALLTILVTLFVVDSIVLFRKGHSRENSHSLLHAGVLVILAVVLIRSATGG